MRHFITFQKKKSLYLEQGQFENAELAHMVNHELMAVGYMLAEPTFRVLSSMSEADIKQVRDELVQGIRRVVGDTDGYEPIYRNFPQSVVELSYTEFVINALIHYWSLGSWRPEDEGHLKRVFEKEEVSYTQVGLLTESKYKAIFSDMLYSNVSLSAFDKECVAWYLAGGGHLNLSKVSFQETFAFVGQALVDSDLTCLPLKRGLGVLRIWAAYSDGDEGLKEKTRFKNPTNAQRRLLLATLDQCVDLEEAFKSKRELWLRLLHYLHPMTEVNRKRYPNVGHYAERLRNEPKSLRTFRSRVEEALRTKDPVVFELLSKRPGEFMRRLDHTVRLFGVEAVDAWLALNLRFEQVVTAYNHFATRAEASNGRAAVLAGQSHSEVVTYEAHEPLKPAVVERIQGALMKRLREYSVPSIAADLFVDQALYLTPLSTNNRAASLSLDGKPVGTREKFEGKVIRAYVHWHGKDDIDLSGFVLTRDNEALKVGWNGQHHCNKWLVYSGDNTGYAEKNAEYLDINTELIPEHVEWIVVEARIYRGQSSFKGYNGKVHMGWMAREKPEANNHWLPETIERATVVASGSRTAYLLAYHAPTRQVVYLDVAKGNKNVSSNQDAFQMRTYLERLAPTGLVSPEMSWKTLNQGHILELLGGQRVEVAETAGVVFDGNTTNEQVARLMAEAIRGES